MINDKGCKILLLIIISALVVCQLQIISFANIDGDCVALDLPKLSAYDKSFILDYKDNFINNKKPVYACISDGNLLSLYIFQTQIYEKLSAETSTSGTKVTAEGTFKLCHFRFDTSTGKYVSYGSIDKIYGGSSSGSSLGVKTDYLINLSNMLTWLGAPGIGGQNKADNISSFAVCTNGIVDNAYSFNGKTPASSSSSSSVPPPSSSSSGSSSGGGTPSFDSGSFLADIGNKMNNLKDGIVNGVKDIFVPKNENIVNDTFTEVQDAFKEKYPDNAENEIVNNQVADLQKSEYRETIDVSIPANAFFEGSEGISANLVDYIKPGADFVKPILTGLICVLTFVLCRAKIILLMKGE